jgi:hypothetical protein
METETKFHYEISVLNYCHSRSYVFGNKSIIIIIIIIITGWAEHQLIQLVSIH